MFPAGSSAEHEVDVGGVERLGIELVRGVDPEPFEHVGVLGVRLIGEGLAKIGVAPHPTAVLRRATALASEAHGVAPAGIGREHLLEDDVVLPVIAEVVDVADALSGFPEQVGDRDSALVAVTEFRVGQPVVDATRFEGMEVVVLPPHRDLDHVVEPAEPHGGGHEQPAPDRRLGCPDETDLQLQDLLAGAHREINRRRGSGRSRLRRGTT